MNERAVERNKNARKSGAAPGVGPKPTPTPAPTPPAAPPFLPKLPDPRYCSKCQHYLLSDVTRQLQGPLSSQQLFALILDTAIRATSAERALLFLRDEKGAPDPRLGRNAAGEDIPSSLQSKVSLGVVRQVVETGKPVAIQNFREEVEWRRRESVASLKLRWALCAPLALTRDGKEHVLGAIYLDSRAAAKTEVEEYLDLLTALCATAAVPLERSLLLERLQREKERFASVAKLAAAVNSASDLAGLLRVGLDVMIKETGSHRGFVMLLDLDRPRAADRGLRFRVGRDRAGNSLGEESFSIHRKHLEDVLRRGESIFEPPLDPTFPANMSDTAMEFRATFPTFIPLKVVEWSEEAAEAAAIAALEPATADAVLTPVRAAARTIGVVCVDSYAQAEEDARGHLVLLETLASQLAVAVEKFRLLQLRLDKDRLEGELRNAEKVQKFLLPRGFPAYPGLSLGGRCLLTHGPGGDYYDFIEIDTDRLAIAMADVSGHGISSSLITCLCRGMLRQHCEEESSPAAILEKTNRRLKREIPSGLFVSAFLGILDTDTLVFTYCNAGLPHPMLQRKDQEAPTLLKVGGMPLGIVRHGGYEEETIRLAAEDTLLLFTDGVVEAEAKDGRRFGSDNLAAVVRAATGQAAQDLVGSVHAGLVSYVGDLRLGDDVTLIALRLHAGVERQVFALQSTEEELTRGVDLILAFLEPRGFVGARATQARLVLTEVLGNAIEHGNRNEAARKVKVRLRSDGTRADVTVRDEGAGYDVETVWDTIHTTDAAADRGRGLFLVARHVPGCRVNRTGNELLLPLTKGLF